MYDFVFLCGIGHSRFPFNCCQILLFAVGKDFNKTGLDCMGTGKAGLDWKDELMCILSEPDMLC